MTSPVSWRQPHQARAWPPTASATSRVRGYRDPEGLPEAPRRLPPDGPGSGERARRGGVSSVGIPPGPETHDHHRGAGVRREEAPLYRLRHRARRRTGAFSAHPRRRAAWREDHQGDRQPRPLRGTPGCQGELVLAHLRHSRTAPRGKRSRGGGRGHHRRGEPPGPHLRGAGRAVRPCGGGAPGSTSTRSTP